MQVQSNTNPLRREAQAHSLIGAIQAAIQVADDANAPRPLLEDLILAKVWALRFREQVENDRTGGAA